MRADEFFLIINELDDELVAEAEGENLRGESAAFKKSVPIKERIAAAACFAVFVVAIVLIAKVRTSGAFSPGEQGVSADPTSANAVEIISSEPAESASSVVPDDHSGESDVVETPPEYHEGVITTVDPFDSRITYTFNTDPDSDTLKFKWNGDSEVSPDMFWETESNDTSLKHLEEFFGTDRLPVDEKFKGNIKRKLIRGGFVCDVEEGAKAYSPVEGRVVAASSEPRYNGGLGAEVAVEFDNKIFVIGHLDEVYVKVGDEVSAGQTLGVCGHSGYVYVGDPPLMQLIPMVVQPQTEISGSESGSEPEAFFKQPQSGDVVYDEESGMSYVKNQLLISAALDAPKERIEQIAEELGAEIVGYIELTNDYQIEFSEDKTIKELETAANYIDSFSFINGVTLNLILDLSVDVEPDVVPS